MKQTCRKGNALFAILIAVALFAALSYAVTLTGRGTRGIDREKADLLAAQILQQVALIQEQIARLELAGGYDEVFLDDSAPTVSGNCYLGKTVTTPCRTVGLFSVEGGLIKPSLINEMQTPLAQVTAASWVLASAEFLVGGVPVGTILPDKILMVVGLYDEICGAINFRIHGDRNIGTYTTGVGNNYGHANLGYINVGGAIVYPQASPVDSQRGFDRHGCARHVSGYNYAIFVIEPY